MRRLTPLVLLPAVLAAAACTTSREDGSQRIETSSEAKRENLEGAVSAPLRDVNLLRTKIPSVLLAAQADPYARPELPPRSPRAVICHELRAQVGSLDDALGPDLDAPKPGEAPGLADRGRQTALGLVSDAASDTIPFRGWVRKLTGAERHDRLVQSAITAGAVRRAYLKGLGEAQGCDPPATPSHVLAGTPAPSQEIKPRYPIR